MQTLTTTKAGLKGVINAIDKALNEYKYRIMTEDGRFKTEHGVIKNAGTGRNSWFNLEEARSLVNYSAGETIVEHDGVNVLWEVF